MDEIYLDHAATTPMHPAVIEAMVDALQNIAGNPSSIHQQGRTARKALDDSRQTIAQSIAAQDDEIIFTGGGSESDNLAIFGTAYARRKEGRHIITSQVEHHAVLHACERLATQGFAITYLPVNDQGVVQVDDFKAALRDDTILVTIMLGNNEVGAIQPIKEIGAILETHQATFHTDAVQAYGVMAIDVDELKVDLLSTTAHKINGPKGIGMLYQRKNTPLQAVIVGGQQERKRRAGTENVPSIVAFAKAVEIAQQQMNHKQALYNGFEKIVMEALTEAGISFEVNGERSNSLPQVLNISFDQMEVESFLVNLDMAGIAVSSGSACTAGSIDPSHVLVAMFGKNSPKLRNSIRFSFGYGLNNDIVTEATKRLVEIVKRLTNA
ncbi:cysteine desulfurase family protein [Kurthia sibirica]|uniref:cysteine desulfurase n=1 Tax=Kurthia sibirica TaxID=202750 RepID=A0A2U3AJY2_9BACL|nr:cysteine desulfurase family protein [Kurthia sibirica]PWI24811.1 cysteine desulfurase NifS [Kurthia sibirica]GEK33343.1 cysteine desulfurase [Kurthia sibirica]